MSTDNAPADLIDLVNRTVAAAVEAAGLVWDGDESVHITDRAIAHRVADRLSETDFGMGPRILTLAVHAARSLGRGEDDEARAYAGAALTPEVPQPRRRLAL